MSHLAQSTCLFSRCQQNVKTSLTEDTKGLNGFVTSFPRKNWVGTLALTVVDPATSAQWQQGVGINPTQPSPSLAWAQILLWVRFETNGTAGEPGLHMHESQHIYIFIFINIYIYQYTYIYIYINIHIYISIWFPMYGAIEICFPMIHMEINSDCYFSWVYWPF